MNGSKDKMPTLSAALAGIPAGLQTRGPWTGRRQLFVKFAVEAETATIYTADALRNEVKRLSGRTRYHSVAIAGREPLAEIDFLKALLAPGLALPAMLEHDGQRPEALNEVAGSLAMVQVCMDGKESSTAVECICRSVEVAAKHKVPHSIAITLGAGIGDAQLLRVIEQVHRVSADTRIVVQVEASEVGEHERRWITWLAEAMALHEDVRVMPQWPLAPKR